MAVVAADDVPGDHVSPGGPGHQTAGATPGPRQGSPGRRPAGALRRRYTGCRTRKNKKLLLSIRFYDSNKIKYFRRCLMG